MTWIEDGKWCDKCGRYITDRGYVAWFIIGFLMGSVFGALFMRAIYD